MFVLTPTCWSRGPSKALPEFLVMPLINFYWLRRPRALVHNKQIPETERSLACLRNRKRVTFPVGAGPSEQDGGEAEKVNRSSGSGAGIITTSASAEKQSHINIPEGRNLWLCGWLPGSALTQWVTWVLHTADFDLKKPSSPLTPLSSCSISCLKWYWKGRFNTLALQPHNPGFIFISATFQLRLNNLNLVIYICKMGEGTWTPYNICKYLPEQQTQYLVPTNAILIQEASFHFSNLRHWYKFNKKISLK